MVWLVLGVLLWSTAHLFPSAAAPARARVAARLGPPYRGVFALVIVASVVLIVVGWRATPPEVVYTPPLAARSVTVGLMLVSLALFLGSQLPTNLKRVVRHPQLAGVLTWSVAHLASNGELRSLVLFGGLGSWAIAAMAFISRRDGAWQKPPPRPASVEWRLAAVTIVAFAALYLLHPYFTGASPRPYFD